MQDLKHSEENRIRSLENWLPLAQAENARHGWGLNGSEVEKLVLRASSALERVVGLLGARAVLWRYHQVPQEERI